MPLARHDPARQFRGPFRGLNTTLDKRQLGPEWTIRQSNMVSSDGRYSPIRPLSQLRHGAGGEPIGVSGEIHALFTFKNRQFPGGVLLIQGGPNLYAYNLERGQLQYPVSLVNVLNDGVPAQFVPFGEIVFVLPGDGPNTRGIRTDGTTAGTRPVGLTFPDTEGRLKVTAGAGGSGGTGVGDNGVSALQLLNYPRRWGYAVTLYNPETQVESNARFTPADGETIPNSSPENHVLIPASQTGWVSIDRAVKSYAIAQGLLIRVYRRQFEPAASEAPAYRLTLQLSPHSFRTQLERGHTPSGAPAIDPYYIDALPENLISDEISTTARGPFAPTRNHPWTHASVGCIYKFRLLLNDTRSPGLVRYSAIFDPNSAAHGEYVHPSDTIDCRGDEDDRITGLLASADQVQVGKAGDSRFWTISGNIVGESNESVAVPGTPRPIREHVVFSNLLRGGPDAGGSGFVRAGVPTSVFFGNAKGFFQYTGDSAVPLSDAIRNDWSTGPRSYAEDVKRGLLYLLIGDDDVWIVDLKNGAWSRMSKATPSPISAVSRLIETGSEPRPSGLLVGCADGTIWAEAQPNETVEHIHPVKTVLETGDFPLAKGNRVHLHRVKVFGVDEQPAPLANANMLCEVLLDAGAEDSPMVHGSGVLRFSDGNDVYISVRAYGETMRLRMTCENWRDPRGAFGVTGWEPVPTLTGQR